MGAEIQLESGTGFLDVEHSFHMLTVLFDVEPVLQASKAQVCRGMLSGELLDLSEQLGGDTDRDTVLQVVVSFVGEIGHNNVSFIMYSKDNSCALSFNIIICIHII